MIILCPISATTLQLWTIHFFWDLSDGRNFSSKRKTRQKPQQFFRLSWNWIWTDTNVNTIILCSNCVLESQQNPVYKSHLGFGFGNKNTSVKVLKLYFQFVKQSRRYCNFSYRPGVGAILTIFESFDLHEPHYVYLVFFFPQNIFSYINLTVIWLV